MYIQRTRVQVYSGGVQRAGTLPVSGHQQPGQWPVAGHIWCRPLASFQWPVVSGQPQLVQDSGQWPATAGAGQWPDLQTSIVFLLFEATTCCYLGQAWLVLWPREYSNVAWPLEWPVMYSSYPVMYSNQSCTLAHSEATGL